MQWTNPLLSLLLSFHYLPSHVVCQLKFPYFNSENNGKNQSNKRFHRPDSNCNSVANSSVLCHPPTQQLNYINYPTVVPVDTKYYTHAYSISNSNHDLYYPSSFNQFHYQPVYSYTNPYAYNNEMSRVDQQHSVMLTSQHQGHENSNMHHHQPENHHHEMEHKGWGWSHGHDNHEKVKKKKKKGKKGPLGKLLKKFKLKRKPEKLIWKEVPECDGFENFIKDMEIISWKLGWLGFKKATIGLALHFLNQVYLTFSVLIVGVPERLTSFIELIAPDTTPEVLRTLLAVFGLVDFFFNKTLSYPLGNLIVAIELVAEILTIASLALATLTIFDDVVEEKVWAIFKIDLREVFEGYGCNNPFNKEKKIEQFF